MEKPAGARIAPISFFAASFAGAAVAALAGCATPTRPDAQTAVAYRTVERPDTPHYELSENEVSTNPLPIDALPPVYPATMVARGIAHVDIRAQVIVAASGTVDDVRIAGDSSRPAEFDEAVRSAVSRWRYMPLRIEQWEDVVDEDGNVVDSRLVRDEAKPFSLDYEFVFDLRDGRPSVRTNPVTSR